MLWSFQVVSLENSYLYFNTQSIIPSLWYLCYWTELIICPPPHPQVHCVSHFDSSPLLSHCVIHLFPLLISEFSEQRPPGLSLLHPQRLKSWFLPARVCKFIFSCRLCWFLTFCHLKWPHWRSACGCFLLFPAEPWLLATLPIFLLLFVSPCEGSEPVSTQSWNLAIIIKGWRPPLPLQWPPSLYPNSVF